MDTPITFLRRSHYGAYRSPAVGRKSDASLDGRPKAESLDYGWREYWTVVVPETAEKEKIIRAVAWLLIQRCCGADPLGSIGIDEEGNLRLPADVKTETRIKNVADHLANWHTDLFEQAFERSLEVPFTFTDADFKHDVTLQKLLDSMAREEDQLRRNRII